MAEKAAMEFETIVMIVIVLAVLLIVLVFFRGGFGKMSSGVGTIGSNVTSKVVETGTNLGSTFTNVFNQWTPCTFKQIDQLTCKSEITAGGCKETVTIAAAGDTATKCGCTLILAASSISCAPADLSIVKESEYLKTCRFAHLSSIPCKADIMKDTCKKTVTLPNDGDTATECGCKLTRPNPSSTCAIGSLTIAPA